MSKELVFERRPISSLVLGARSASKKTRKSFLFQKSYFWLSDDLATKSIRFDIIISKTWISYRETVETVRPKRIRPTARHQTIRKSLERLFDELVVKAPKYTSANEISFRARNVPERCLLNWISRRSIDRFRKQASLAC